MNNFIVGIIGYIVSINLITFILFGNDKRRSRRGDWRISEKALLGLCVIGGAVGGFWGMRVFHHKTKHFQFFLGIPIIFILQVGIIIFLLVRRIY